MTSETNGYDPTNILEHTEKTFITDSKSEYSIDLEGKLHREPKKRRIDGAKVELIAGIDSEVGRRAIGILVKNRESWKNYIMENGQKPEEGLPLAILLAEDEPDEIGLFTTPLDKIIPSR